MIMTILGAVWRWVDGRAGRPNNWNVPLFLGYGFACSLLPYDWYTQLAIFALAMINILSGFDTFTLPWFKYHLGYITKEELEQPHMGFSSWHTAYRFLPPVLIACALTEWDATWIWATINAGALFPATEVLKVPYREHIREAYLGAIVLGGPFWVATLTVWW